MHSLHARELDHQLLIRLRESLIDTDIVVDDSRREIDQALVRLRAAVAERDAVALKLAELIETAA